MNLIGDVKGKVAVMVDDMIDTAGEFCSNLICCYHVFEACCRRLCLYILGDAVWEEENKINNISLPFLPASLGYCSHSYQYRT